jgi:diamine N-acetyltransferase
MVGFVMLGFYEKKQMDIWRFMIDERYQKKGYGKAALTLAIEYLRREFNVSEIFLSFVPDNTAAEKLYESAGFRKTGESDDDGEIIMRLEIK